VKSVEEIRHEFREQLRLGQIVPGAKPDDDTIEILAAQFEPKLHCLSDRSIFGRVDEDYVERELQWYESQSLKVADMRPPVPKIWQDIASLGGEVNSNYGWCIWSWENGSQYESCLRALQKDPLSRRACMIYQRPSMHVDWYRDGMKDFMCTDAVHCFLRPAEGIGLAGPAELELHYHVFMRSNDAVFGFKNDFAWHKHVMENLATDLSVSPASLIWHAASLHVYRRHFPLLVKGAPQ
jgi:thymidylate synthase